MKFFKIEEEYREQNETDPKKFYDEFWTMTCFNCNCPNHSKSEMACGLKNIEISRDGKCIYWSEMNKKKTKLMYKGKEIDEEVAAVIEYIANPFLEKYLEHMKEAKKTEDNKINPDSPFTQLDSEFIRNLVKEAKKEGIPVSICF